MDWRNSDNKEKDGGRMENEANKKDEGTKKEEIHIYIYTYIVKSGQSPLQEVVAHYFLTSSKTFLVL